MKALQAKKLNLFDALRLAAVLAKYIDTKDIEADPLDFISALLNKLTPLDYLHSVELLTGEEAVEAYPSIEIITAFVEGLKSNQIVSLISFSKSLGI